MATLSDRVGCAVEGYRVVAANGRNGKAVTCHAVEEGAGRTVALHVLEGGDEAEVEGFLTEARITAQLEHPGIVPVYAVGCDAEGRSYYATKLVRGITLRTVLGLMEEGVEATVRKYPLGVLLTVFRKACDAVAYAHSRGVVHRNLKPENISLGDFGEVFVMNWGRALVLDAQRGEREGEMEVVGTPEYMSPEQARGDAVDACSDVYALGAILYRILSLRAPVQRGASMEMLERVGGGEVLPLVAPKHGGATHLPGGRIPSALGAVVGQAMAFEPARRYQSVAELQADVEAFQGGFPTSAERVRPWKRAVLFLWRHRGVSVPAALAILLVAAFGMQVLHAGRRAQRAIASLRDTAPSLRELAEREAGVGRLEGALQPLLVAERLEPESLETLVRRGFVFAGLAQMKAAAADFRRVLSKDPEHAVAGRALPILTNLALTVPEKWAAEDRLALFKLLSEQRLSGELAALSEVLQLTSAQRIEVVKIRLSQWLGNRKDSSSWANLAPLTSLVRVGISGREVARIDDLRGLPIDELHLSSTEVSDLSPLRGMGLKILKIEGLPVSDLSPLVGMPLENLQMSGTRVEDIGPLRGMPLKVLNVERCRIEDFSALEGLPLRELGIERRVAPLVSEMIGRHPTLEKVKLDSESVSLAEFRRRYPSKGAHEKKR